MYFHQRRSENISNLPELDSKRTTLKYRSAVLTTFYHEEGFRDHEIKKRKKTIHNPNLGRRVTGLIMRCSVQLEVIKTCEVCEKV